MAKTGIAISVALLLVSVPVAAQQLNQVHVRGPVYMLQGKGGNIGVFAGRDGFTLIDDQYAPANPQIIAALNKIKRQPVRWVINTHWHGDHTGGNEQLALGGAMIVAHRNARQRLSTDQTMEFFSRTVPASPDAALPVLTFTSDIRFHLDNETVDVVHVANAHTDGDSLVFFARANVIHMGDTFFNGSFPFVDESSGGSISGMIDAVDRALSLADEQTLVIPGHGSLASRVELQNYRDMLATVRSRVHDLKNQGKSLHEIVSQDPTKGYESFGDGFIKSDDFVRFVFNGVGTTL